MESSKAKYDDKAPAIISESKDAETNDNQNNQTENNPNSIKTLAGDALTQIKDKTNDVLSEQRSNLTSGIKDVAGSIRKVAENLEDNDQSSNVGKLTVQYGTNFAQSLEKFSSYVEKTNLKDLARDVETFARRQPTLFVAGAFALGLIAARFLKTAHPLENFNVKLPEDTTGNKAKIKQNYPNPKQMQTA